MNQVTTLIFKLTSFFSVCVLLSPLVILIYLDKVIDAMLRGLDKQVGVMYCNIVDLISTIVLIYTLVPVFGIYGYIAIIAISEILNFTISLIQLYKASHFKFDFISYVFVPLILVLVTKFLFDAIDNYIEYELGFVLLKIAIFIGVYLVLLGIFNVFRHKKAQS